MEKDYWLNKWQSQDIVFHEKNINQYLMAYIHQLNVKEGDCIFVPLCGKSKDMLWLAENGFHVVGVELSPIACNDFFAELNVIPNMTKQNKFTKYQYNNIDLLCGDLFDLTKTDLPIIHAVYDCKALIALPPDLQRKYVNHLIATLGAHVNILLLTRESNCNVIPPPFSVDSEAVNLLYGAYFDIVELARSPVTKIPKRLIEKGYKEMTECAYLISRNDVDR